MRWTPATLSMTVALVALLLPATSPAGPTADRAALEARVLALLDEHGDGVVAGIWVGGVDGLPWFVLEPDVPRPAASAIKTAYLVALFARFADDLDASPPGLDDALTDDHPAMTPYSPSQRAEIREALAGASVRNLGGIMMGSIPAPNHVYNAAASVVTAEFGGPEALSAAILALDPGFAPIVSRRYMLAPRDEHGDNEASAAAIALVLRRLASGEWPGVDDATRSAIREAIVARDGHLDLDGLHRIKSGSLNSDPMARIQSGWWEAPGVGPVVYAVMLSQPDPAGRPRAEAGDRLEELAGTLTTILLETFRASQSSD